MANTPAQMETHLDAARGFIALSDWTSAELELLQAETVLAGLADGAGAGTSVRWSDRITLLRKDIAARRRAATGLQTTKSVHKRVSAST